MGKSDEDPSRSSTTGWPRPPHHDGSDVFGIVSVQVELECHHLVVVRLQLTLHHAVHFIRELQRQTGSVTAGFCLLPRPASKAEHKRNNTLLCVSTHMKRATYITMLIRPLWWIKLHPPVILPLWCAASIAPSSWTSSQQFSWRPFSRSSPTGPRSHRSNPRSRRRHNCKVTWLFLENMTPKIISHFITYNRDIQVNQASVMAFAVSPLTWLMKR